MRHDFEDVEIKINAPLLLEDALKRKRKKCMVGTGAMSDPYIPIPENLANIRSCLEIIERHGCGLAIQTKSNLILRDLELIKKINEKAKCVVETTLTTYDEALCKILEPHVCTTKVRFEMLMTMRDNGIKTIVWISPILPFINDTAENLRGLLQYCVEAKVYGIINFGIGLTLREGDREYFYQKLDEHFPGMKQKYRRKYGNSYQVMSDNNNALMQEFYTVCQQHDIVYGPEKLFSYMRTYEDKHAAIQPDLFSEPGKA
jgi:DNA repair photolyase